MIQQSPQTPLTIFPTFILQIPFFIFQPQNRLTYQTRSCLRFLFRHFGIIRFPNTYMLHRYTNILPICEYKVKRPFVITCAAKVFVSDWK